MSESSAGSASLGSPSIQEALEARVRRLAARRGAWVRTGIPERIDLLRRSLDLFVEVAPDWVAAACRAKGIPPAAPLAGEEWISGPMTTVRNVRLFIDALKEGGQPKPRRFSDGPGGRIVAHVLPHTLIERSAYLGLSAEMWIAPGMPATQGRIYREKEAGRFGEGALALVLGAGNVASIAPLDVLHKLIVEDEVAILKMNPVNEYLAPFLEHALGPFIAEGFADVVTGGRETGEFLAHHPLVDAIHLTGSDKTYDAIVWGATPEERARRKAAQQPLVAKRFTAELGCVTPVVVLPGNWSDGDLAFQARHVASMVAHNASFNCTAAKVLVLPRMWHQREAFLEHLAHAMAHMPPRRAYYPGAHDRFAGFLSRYPQAQRLGAGGRDIVPWTLIRDVQPKAGEYALTNEAFCGILAEVSVEGDDVPSFLERAVGFVNDEVWGTLSAVMLVHRTGRRGHHGAIEQALADMRYGSIGVNAWTGANYAFGVTSWGAYPGHTRERIGSGVGTVHNAFLFDHPEKSVVRAPFRIFPTPIWFGDHRTLGKVGPLAVRFEHDNTWSRLVPLALAALRG